MTMSPYDTPDPNQITDEQLRKFLAQYQLTPEDRSQAKGMGLLGFGLALAGARKGQEFPALANAGLLGMNQYRDQIGQSLAEKRNALQSAAGALSLKDMMQKQYDQAQTRKIAEDFYDENGQPGIAAQQQTGPPSPTVGMGPPDPAGAMQQQPLPTAAPVSTAQPAGGPSKSSKFDQYSALAQAYASKGQIVAAQQMADMAEKFRPKLKDTKTLMQNGQRVTVNLYDDGTTQVLPFSPDAEKAHFLDTGAKIGAVDPFSGKPIPGGGMYSKEMSPAEIASNKIAQGNLGIAGAHLNETIRHNQMVEGDPATIEATAQGIASGNLAPLNGYALGRPMGQAVMARVMQIKPDFSGKDFGTGQKAEKDFATGKPGAAVRSFNVALAHLDTLDTLAGALNNGDVQLFNKAGNFLQQQTGNPAPTNFVAAKKIVSDEIVKAIVGSGGGVADREEAARTISSANSPAQLKGVINTYKELMKGQLGGLRQQYETSTGRKDFDRFLSGAAKDAVAKQYGTDVRSQADAIIGGQ